MWHGHSAVLCFCVNLHLSWMFGTVFQTFSHDASPWDNQFASFTSAHCFSTTTRKPNYIFSDIPTTHISTSWHTAMQNEWGLWNVHAGCCCSMHVGFDSSSMKFDNWYAASVLLRPEQPGLEGGRAADSDSAWIQWTPDETTYLSFSNCSTSLQTGSEEGPLFPISLSTTDTCIRYSLHHFWRPTMPQKNETPNKWLLWSQ